MESLKNMYEEFGICDAIYEFGQKTEEKLKTRFDAIDKSSSPGLKFENSARAIAWVPHVICGLTSASSVWNVSAYTFSSVSLPSSL